jgi:hypothetical protein
MEHDELAPLGPGRRPVAGRSGPGGEVPASVQPAPRLLPSLCEAIRVRHYSLRTEQAYVGWVRRFIHFHGLRHPRELGAAEVEALLSHLAI